MGISREKPSPIVSFATVSTTNALGSSSCTIFLTACTSFLLTTEKITLVSLPEYNLLTRGIEAEDLPFCAENDVAVLTYNSIAKGILSGAFHFGGKVVTDFRTAKPLFQPDALRKETPLLTLLRDVAADHGVTLSQVAIAASLAHAGVSSTIVGTQNEQHFLDNLAAAELVLTEAELTAIDETSARVIASL